MSTLLNDYLSRTELAAELGVCERTLIRWSERGEAPRVSMIGRRPMFRRAAINAWLASREQPVAA